MTKSHESKPSSNCKWVMHDLDGVSDQDIMFGHTRDETIVYLTTSFGKDLTDSYKNRDVQRLQSEGKTRSTIT